MEVDLIEALGLDESGSLWVKPTTSTFPYIYREAMEVGWDPERLCLFSPKPREWSYPRWFQQIRAAARQQGAYLRLGPTTRWSNIDASLRHEIAVSESQPRSSSALTPRSASGVSTSTRAPLPVTGTSTTASL